jgi:hypothetical protein
MFENVGQQDEIGSVVSGRIDQEILNIVGDKDAAFIFGAELVAHARVGLNRNDFRHW